MKPIKKDYDETYINSLLKRGVRNLDLFEVADVYEAVCIDAAGKLAEDEILSDLKKNMFAMIRERIRVSNEKLTIDQLDDRARTDPDWKNYLESVKVFQQDVQILKAKIQKWEYYQSATVMQVSRENKTRV